MNLRGLAYLIDAKHLPDCKYLNCNPECPTEKWMRKESVMTKVDEVMVDSDWPTAPEHRPQIKWDAPSGCWQIEISKAHFELLPISKKLETDEKVVIEVRSR